MRSIRSGILAWLPIRLRRGRGTQNRSQMLFLTYERESREKRALPNHPGAAVRQRAFAHRAHGRGLSASGRVRTVPEDAWGGRSLRRGNR